MEEQYTLMKFHVKVLKFLRIWPNNKEYNSSVLEFVQKYFLLLFLIPTSVPLLVDTMLMMSEPDCDISFKIHSIIILICTINLYYMMIGTLSNNRRVKNMVDKLHSMQKYRPNFTIHKVDKRATFVSKVMMAYSIVGGIIYALAPLLEVQNCEGKRTQTMKDLGIPCGLVCRVRLPIKFDYSPMYELMYGHQAFLVVVDSLVVCFLTILMYAFILLVTHNMRMLREMLMELSDCEEDNLEQKVTDVILYHIDIIGFCEEFNASFSTAAFMYMSIISCLTGLLGFEFLKSDVPMEKLQAALHYIGVILLDLIVCCMGQTLVNESLEIGHDAYSIAWYNFPVKVQKNIRFIIMRSQKPIVWSTLSFGHLSLELFLKIMYSSYSYLTLLSNSK